MISDTLQDVIILQNRNKMKAALSKNVRISFTKVCQTNKDQPKSLTAKGVPTNITDDEFKDFLDLNKITYAKAEHLESTKNGRVL